MLLVVGCLSSSQGWFSSSRADRVSHGSGRIQPARVMGAAFSQRGHGAVEAFPSHETQRLAQGRAKSQVPRDARNWWPCQRHRGNAGDYGVTPKTGPLHPEKATNPPNWAGRRYFLTRSVSSGSVSCRRSGRFLRQQRVGGQFTVLDDEVLESWRLVCGVRPRGVRGRGKIFSVGFLLLPVSPF